MIIFASASKDSVVHSKQAQIDEMMSGDDKVEGLSIVEKSQKEGVL